MRRRTFLAALLMLPGLCTSLWMREPRLPPQMPQSAARYGLALAQMGLANLVLFWGAEAFGIAAMTPVLFVFLNRTRSQVKILYWERNGFCLWLKRLEAERFKTKPDAGDEAIELTVDELNWLLDGIDLWRNRPHQVLTPRYVA